MTPINKLTAVLALLLLLISTGQAQSAMFSGKVIKVTDGDTITVVDSANAERNVRIEGIDAPEEGQAFYEEAKKRLSDLLLDKEVTVEIVRKDNPTREVGIVRLDDQDVGLQMVESGLAWHNEFFDTEQSPDVRTSYSFAQLRAHGSKRGVWTEAEPISPWAFRRTHQPESSRDDSKTASTGTATSTPQTNSGGTVQVKGYYRKDGTYVHPHTRSAPRKKN